MTQHGDCNSFAGNNCVPIGSSDRVSSLEMAQHAEASKHTRHAADTWGLGSRAAGDISRQAAAVGLDTSHLPAVLHNEQTWYGEPPCSLAGADAGLLQAAGRPLQACITLPDCALIVALLVHMI